MAVFKLIEELVYYGIGFRQPCSTAHKKGPEHEKTVQRLIRDPFLIVSLGSLFTGTCLNLSGIQRPPFFSLLNTILIPLSTVILLTTIGMAMSFGKTGRYLKESLAISGVKFLSSRRPAHHWPHWRAGRCRGWTSAENDPYPLIHADGLHRPGSAFPLRPRPGPCQQLLACHDSRACGDSSGPVHPPAPFIALKIKTPPVRPAGSSRGLPPSCWKPPGQACPPLRGSTWPMLFRTASRGT